MAGKTSRLPASYTPNRLNKRSTIVRSSNGETYRRGTLCHFHSSPNRCTTFTSNKVLNSASRSNTGANDCMSGVPGANLSTPSQKMRNRRPDFFSSALSIALHCLSTSSARSAMREWTALKRSFSAIDFGQLVSKRATADQSPVLTSEQSEGENPSGIATSSRKARSTSRPRT